MDYATSLFFSFFCSELKGTIKCFSPNNKSNFLFQVGITLAFVTVVKKRFNVFLLKHSYLSRLQIVRQNPTNFYGFINIVINYTNVSLDVTIYILFVRNKSDADT